MAARCLLTFVRLFKSLRINVYWMIYNEQQNDTGYYTPVLPQIIGRRACGCIYR